MVRKKMKSILFFLILSFRISYTNKDKKNKNGNLEIFLDQLNVSFDQKKKVQKKLYFCYLEPNRQEEQSIPMTLVN